MAKSIILLIFLCSFLSCKEKTKQIDEDLPVAVNDTFEFVYKDHVNIPEGIYLDTITKVYENDIGTGIIIRPRLKTKQFDAIDKLLMNEFTRRMKGNTSTTMGKEVSQNVVGWTKTIEPVSLYKSGKIISYAFLVTYSDSMIMRPFRMYFSINYDIAQNKLLHPDDYFNIKSATDSSTLSYIIYSSVGEGKDSGRFGYDNDFDFAIDESKVYFYFDQFTVGGSPAGLEGSAKKKYFLNLIKNEYR